MRALRGVRCCGKAADHVERALAQLILKFDDVFVRTQFLESLAADLVERPGAFELRREIRRDARAFGRGRPHAQQFRGRVGLRTRAPRSHDASARHTSAVLVSEMCCGNMDDSTAARDSAAAIARIARYFTRMETSAVRPRESRAVILCGPSASGQWNGASLDERPASTPSMDQ